MVIGRQVVIALCAALAAGCGLFGSRTPQPPLVVAIAAAERLNPDERGQSLPTVLQIYQLSSTGRLEGAEFEQLYRGARETLGPELLRLEEVTVTPGVAVERRVERDGAARAVAVVALVRRPSGKSWRVVVPLPPKARRGDVLRVRVEEYRVERR